MKFKLPWWNDIPPYPFYIKNRADVIRIHITKTAGTSLTKAMKFNRIRKRKGMKKHYFVKEVIDEVGQEKWDTAFKFTFVRNPWDRIYSFYRFLLQNNVITSEEESKSYKVWLKELLRRLKLHPTRMASSKPQVEWLRDHQEQINLDFIGRFENLHEDVETLAKKLDIKINKLPHVYQSLPVVHYSTGYDDESEELIREYYKEDIETFNFTFERK